MEPLEKKSEKNQRTTKVNTWQKLAIILALSTTLSGCSSSENKHIDEEINKIDNEIEIIDKSLEGKDLDSEIENIVSEMNKHYKNYVVLSEYYQQNKNNSDKRVQQENKATARAALEEKKEYLELFKDRKEKIKEKIKDGSDFELDDNLLNKSLNPNDLNGINEYVKNHTIIK